MKRTWETVRAGAWIGWQVDANWADPFFFIVFAIAKPLATTLILFLMAKIVSGGAVGAAAFHQLFIGNTFFLYVTEVLIGISWAVFRDREDYETMKYIYVAPIRFLHYLLGRGLTKIVTASIGVAVALAFGALVLGVPIRHDAVTLARLVAVTLVGLIGVAWLGVALAGISLVVARHSINLNEGLGGIFYLLCGAVFPLDVLPAWAQRISLLLPFTYWLELLRRILTGTPYSRILRGMGDGTLTLILAASTVATVVVGYFWFARCERTARARGLIDWKSNY
ncbi:MAG TPA: ABC transporter permease [Candidatus Eisenbacteria bacterium]|nr:ABC transporter permease [Candidatus Eisenbacteria bacterium]